MNGYGVSNAYGDLKRVIMHRPGPELGMVTEKTLAEFHFNRPVDRVKFLADYDTMLGLFQAHGVETLLLSEILKEDEDALFYMARRPNVTYTRDLAVVLAGMDDDAVAGNDGRRMSGTDADFPPFCEGGGPRRWHGKRRHAIARRSSPLRPVARYLRVRSGTTVPYGSLLLIGQQLFHVRQG